MEANVVYARASLRLARLLLSHRGVGESTRARLRAEGDEGPR